MASKRCGFPPLLLLALPLLLLAATSRGHDFNQCQVPRLDQEFCNSFYSVCLASPDKLCLAQSMSQCLDRSAFPSGILYSIRTYLMELVNRMRIIVGPLQFGDFALSPPPLPPSPTSPSTRPSQPLPLPRPTQPLPLPRPQQQPLLPLTLIKPHPMPLPPFHPSSVIIPPPPKTPSLSPPHIQVNVTRPHFIPGMFSTPSWPPKIGSSLITVYETGNDYLDYFVSLLLSLPEKKIQNIIGVMISDISRVEIGLGQVSSQDINVLLLKLKYLLQRYSIQEFDLSYVDTYLHYLLTSNASLFNWFSMVLDQIFVDLKIHLSSGGSDLFPRFSLEGVFSTNVAYRQSVDHCNGAPVSEAVCERFCTNNYGGNWIAIQYRERDMELSGAFDRSLNEYVRGFGDFQTGYWMGLACLSDITSRHKMELLVELADASGVTALAHYGHFWVGDQSAGYPLQLGTFLGGAAGDGLRSAEGRPFTTRDKDRDQFKNNCAVKHKGGWWYANCQQTSVKNYLNGYFSSASTKNDLAANFPNFGVRWQTFDTTYVLVSTRMFMRRALATSEEDFPMHGSVLAVPYGLETFRGLMGIGEETYGATYGKDYAGVVDEYEELYAVPYGEAYGGKVGGYGETYAFPYGEAYVAEVGGYGEAYAVSYGDTYGGEVVGYGETYAVPYGKAYRGEVDEYGETYAVPYGEAYGEVVGKIGESYAVPYGKPYGEEVSEYGETYAVPYDETYGGKVGRYGETYAVSYGEPYGGEVGEYGESYAVPYDESYSGEVGGYGESYGVAYRGGARGRVGGDGASLGAGRETYEYDAGDYALMLADGDVTSVGGGGGAPGGTYGNSAGRSTGGGRGIFE